MTMWALALPTTRFAPHVDYPTGQAPNGVAVGDFNADGKSDLAVANQTATPCRCSSAMAMAPFSRHVDYATGIAATRWKG